MKLEKNIIEALLVLMCSIAVCQAGSADGESPGESFVAEGVKLPPVIAYGLRWPTAEQISNKSIPTCAEAQHAVEEIMSKCMKATWYDPNSGPRLISLGDWPRLYAVTRIARFEKTGYVFQIYDNIAELFVGIKRSDGQDIWDMQKKDDNFISQMVSTFFNDESIGPRAGKEIHYVPNKDGSDGFYCVYLPRVNTVFSAAYMWTNGKTLALRVEKSGWGKGKIATKENR